MVPLGLAGAVLLWAIVSRSLVPSLTTTAPNLSIGLRPGDPGGVIAFAQKELALPVSTGDADPPHVSLDELRALLESTLAAQPLNAPIFSLLGLIAQRDGDVVRATALMNIAARLSPHETIALDWLMRERFTAHDYPQAAHYADLLLKNGDTLMDFALPVLARMSEIAEAQPHVDALLAAHPPWRDAFLFDLNDAVTDPRTPLKLFLQLKERDDPPRRSELDAYLLFLIRHNLFELAYYAWLQFLTPQQLESVGNLYDGSFLHPLANTPFDWRLPAGINYTAGIALKPGATGDYALNVEFGNGRVEFQDITQMILLKPGPYRFKGQVHGDVIGPRGLQWSVRCSSGETLGEGPMIVGTVPGWQTFDFGVSVPPTCPVQFARLAFTARSASEQLVSGSVWFDDLSIVRPDPPVPPPAPPPAPSPASQPTPTPVTSSVPSRSYSPAASKESTGVGRTRSSR